MLLFFLDTNVFVSSVHCVDSGEERCLCTAHITVPITDHLGKVTGLESKNRDIKDGVSG